MGDILFAVTPLVSGVGAGAVLALVNQGLLHWTGQRIEALRMLVRTWFDVAIWSAVDRDAQAATVKAIAAVERMAVAVSDAADRQMVSANRLTASASTIHDSARDFRGAVEAVGGQIQGVPQTLTELTSAIQVSSTALENLIHVGSRTAANLDVSVAAFRTTVDREFASVARGQLDSTQGLAEAIRQIGTTTELLKVSSQNLKDTVDASKTSVRSLNESLEQKLVPGQSQMQAVVDHLAVRLDALARHLDSVAGEVAANHSHHALHDALARLEGSVAALQRFHLTREELDGQPQVAGNE